MWTKRFATLGALLLLMLAVVQPGMLQTARAAVTDDDMLQVAGFPFFDDFEATTLGAEWSTSTGSAGTVELTTNYARSGAQSMSLGQKVGGGAIASLILEVDLSGQTDVFLDFWVRATGSDESRRVYISDNSGASWTQVSNLDSASQSFSHIVIDL
ncbi:MAG: hypothetical protein MI924_36795, partial [Chloroflexales bacterium]|nr:hypothetical protein [Chloroflexales bacterium]